jgi:hypothetical protein
MNGELSSLLFAIDSPIETRLAAWASAPQRIALAGILGCIREGTKK